jgi:hypothetical protein
MIATVQVQYHTDLSTSPQDTPSNTSVVAILQPGSRSAISATSLVVLSLWA